MPTIIEKSGLFKPKFGFSSSLCNFEGQLLMFSLVLLQMLRLLDYLLQLCFGLSSLLCNQWQVGVEVWLAEFEMKKSVASFAFKYFGC